MSARDDSIREAQGLLRHYFDRAGVITDPDCGSEIDKIVERIVEAAEASARRRMTREQLAANIAVIAERARQAVGLTVPDRNAAMRLSGDLVLPPQHVTRQELLDSCACTAAAVYLATLELLGVEVEALAPQPRKDH